MGDTRAPQFQGVLIAFLIACTISVAARVYTRVALVRIFAAEDWLAVATFVLYVAYTACALIATTHGLCSHVSDVSLEERPKAIMWRWIAITFYILVSGMTKLIVGIFLTRVCTRQRWHNITLWVIMGVIAVYSVFYAVLNINSCHPIEHEWLRYGVDPVDLTHCNNKWLGTIPTYIAAFLNVLVDWILAIVPATVLWNLKMEKKLKITTYIVLAIGSIASVASIVRIPYASDFLISPDYLYQFTDLGIWSTVEIGAGLSASCLATLKPLFRKIRTGHASSHPMDGSGISGSLEYHKARRSSIPRVYRPDLPNHYALVSITSEGKFSRLQDSDAIVVKREISATDVV
ncbi:putative Integral membrane protein [Seiridium unicorne]|uniref:Integral membrane protein n=1 Tax=Seiridium unicorne TaxID=138068 RepID=A0ABR2UZB2_9PEZI